MSRPARENRDGGGGRLGLLLCLAGLAVVVGCSGGEKLSQVEQSSRVVILSSGWEYRFEAPAALESGVPVSPPAAGEWQALSGLASWELAGKRDIWLRVPLPTQPEEPARLFVRLYAPVFALYLNGSLLYRFGDPAPEERVQEVTYHVVSLPPGWRGQVLFGWVPRVRPGDLTAGEWTIVATDEFAAVFTRHLKAALQWNLMDALLGVVLTVGGVVALALGLSRWRRRHLLLLSFGAFVVLYGLRLLAGSHLVLFMGLPLLLSWYAASIITYVINIPAWLFFLQLLGRGWRSSLLWQGRAFGLFAVVGITSDLLQREPFSAGLPNNLLVIAGIAVVGGNLYWMRHRRRREIGVLVAGFVAFGLSALNDNLVGLGALPWDLQAESLGFAVFVGCLGYLATQHFYRNEARLVALESELETARRIQASILPSDVPRLEGLAVAARYIPVSSVAGDLYDFLPSAPHGLGLLVADVSGHGVPAALIASMVKVAASSQLANAADPARVLAGLNQELCDNLGREFVTAAYLFFDARSRRLLASSAGHPYPLIWRRAEEALGEIEKAGVLLGHFPGARYDNARLSLQPGDRIIVYTDGVVEARNADGEMFGDERLKSFVRTKANLAAEAFADALVAQVSRWSGSGEGASLDDDLTLVVVDVVGESETDPFAGEV